MDRNQPYEPRTGAWRHLYASIAWDGGAVAVSATRHLARRALPGGVQVVKDWLVEGSRGDLVGQPARTRLSLTQRRQVAGTGASLRQH